MKRIGLTGNIGTGKSTVAWMLEDLGSHIIDADKIAHQAIHPHSKAWAELFQRFGKAILLDDGVINRQELARIIFSNQDDRKFVESIIHPHVAATVEKELAHLEKAGVGYCVVEVPLLFEVRWNDRMDLVVVVSCTKEQEIERCRQKWNLTREEALQRIESQWPLERKIAEADIVIDNAGSLEETRVQVERLFRAWEKGQATSASFS